MQDMTAEQAARLESAKKDILRKILTKKAFERLGRVRIANPLIAAQIELYLVQVFQSGQLDGQIDDKKLKQILSVLSEKRKIKIKRK